MGRVFAAFVVFAVFAGCGGGSNDGGGGGDQDAGTPPSQGAELPLPTAQVTYYVSSSVGNDEWSGTVSEPTGSDGPKATLDAALELLNGAQPGTHVLLRSGDSWDVGAPMEIGAATGTQTDPVVLGSYGDGAQPTLVSSHDGATIVVRGNGSGASEYFRIHDLRLTHNSPSDGQLALYTGESFHPNLPHHLTFSSLTVEGNGAGMTLYAHDQLVHGSRVANNNFGMGIYVQADNVSFQYNDFENNGLPPPDVFVHSLYISACNGVLFENNVVRSATDGVKVRRSNNGIFRHNTFHDIKAIGIHLGGDSDGGTTNNRIESNHFYENSSGIVIKSESGTQVEPVDGLVIANNILHAGTEDFVDYGAHITLTDVPAQNVAIVNNLVYESGSDAGIRMSNAGPGHVCRNNLIGQFGGAAELDLDPGVAAGNNLALPGAPQFENLALVDPSSNDFHPTSGSTSLIDQGADVSEFISTDYDGNPRSQGGGTDIGPYELAP